MFSKEQKGMQGPIRTCLTGLNKKLQENELNLKIHTWFYYFKINAEKSRIYVEFFKTPKIYDWTEDGKKNEKH